MAQEYTAGSANPSFHTAIAIANAIAVAIRQGEADRPARHQAHH